MTTKLTRPETTTRTNHITRFGLLAALPTVQFVWPAGTKKRLGFRRKEVTSFSVHRSEEVAPLEARHLVKQNSSVSEGESSMSGDSSSRYVSSPINFSCTCTG